VTVSSRDELEEERDFLLSSLRDLEREREAGELSQRDYQALHDDYTARAALTGSAVLAFSGQRNAGAPITGSLPETPSGRLQQALQLESEGKAADALKIYDDMLKADPRNVQALAYRGWLLKRAGLPDLAMAALDQAIGIDPRFPDAHFFRGMVLYQDRSDPAGAVTEFRLFLSNNPPQEMVPLVEDVLRRAMADAGQALP
jgi:tetratricopeptide (TPR) repeat protein